MKSALSPGVSGAGAVAGTVAPAFAIWEEIAARLSLSACSRDSSASSARWRSACGRLQLGEARLGLIARGGDFALLDRDRVARLLDPQADRLHPPHRGLGLVAQPLDPLGDRVVVVLDLAQVVGPRAHLRPARRLEHHVQHVGAARLVDRDQALAQHDQRPAQPGPDLGPGAASPPPASRSLGPARPAWRPARPRSRPGAGAAPRLRRSSSRSRRSARRSTPRARSGSAARRRACPARRRISPAGSRPARWPSPATSAQRAAQQRRGQQQASGVARERGAHRSARRLTKSPKNC